MHRLTVTNSILNEWSDQGRKSSLKLKKTSRYTLNRYPDTHKVSWCKIKWNLRQSRKKREKQYKITIKQCGAIKTHRQTRECTRWRAGSNCKADYNHRCSTRTRAGWYVYSCTAPFLLMKNNWQGDVHMAWIHDAFGQINIITWTATTW